MPEHDRPGETRAPARTGPTLKRECTRLYLSPRHRAIDGRLRALPACNARPLPELRLGEHRRAPGQPLIDHSPCSLWAAGVRPARHPGRGLLALPGRGRDLVARQPRQLGYRGWSDRQCRRRWLHRGDRACQATGVTARPQRAGAPINRVAAALPPDTMERSCTGREALGRKSIPRRSAAGSTPALTVCQAQVSEGS